MKWFYQPGIEFVETVMQRPASQRALAFALLAGLYSALPAALVAWWRCRKRPAPPLNRSTIGDRIR